MEALDERLIERVVRALVYKRAWQFRDFVDYDDDDLTAECVAESIKAIRARYDPARAKLSTFVTHVSDLHLRFLLRGLKRRAHRESHAPPASGIAAPSGDQPNDLALWLADVHTSMRLIFASSKLPLRVPGMNRRYMDRAQRASLLLLQRHLNVSLRGLESLLNRRADLRAILGLARAPDHSTLCRIAGKKSVARLGIFRLPPAVVTASLCA